MTVLFIFFNILGAFKKLPSSRETELIPRLQKCSVHSTYASHVVVKVVNAIAFSVKSPLKILVLFVESDSTSGKCKDKKILLVLYSA